MCTLDNPAVTIRILFVFGRIIVLIIHIRLNSKDLLEVELLHLLLHLRPGLRHFSLLRHNPHCSTRLCTMARCKCID